MGNPFDIFDGASAARKPGNPFDAFDTPPSPAPLPGADPGALQIRVGARPSSAPDAQAEPAPAPATMSREAFDARFYGGAPAGQPMSSRPDALSPLAGPLHARAAGMQARDDEALIGKPSGGNDALAAALSGLQGATLNAGGNVAAGVATALGALGATGYSPRSFSENYKRFQDILGAHGRQSPKSSVAGSVAGALATAPLLPAPAPAAGLMARVGQYGATGASYGFAGELLDSKSLPKAAGAGAIGGALGAPLGIVAEKLAPPVVNAVTRVLEPLMQRGGAAISKPSGGFSLEAQNALRAAGFDPNTLPSELALHLQQVFSTKGASPSAIREAQAAEFGIPLSRGQATRDPAALLFERLASSGAKGAKAEEIGRGFLEEQRGSVLNARDVLLQALAGKRTPIDTPRAGSEGVSAAARRISDDTAFRASTAQRGADQALEAVRGHGLAPDPLDAASMVSQSVRDAAQQGREGYRAAYADVAEIPGTFMPGALDRMGTRVRDRIGADLPIDDVLTPAASRALADLDNIPGVFRIEPGSGPNLQQLDQLRKRLVTYRGSTTQNPTDRAAMDRILREFDGHAQDAMAAGLFGQQQAARVADDFPGASALSADASSAALTLPEAPAGSPETLVRYLARNGGIRLDDEARAADLNRLYVPGAGTLARRDGLTMDQWRTKLVADGFLPHAEGEAASARDVADWMRDAIHAERIGGQPKVRIADEGRLGGQRAAERVADENADHAAMMDRQARRIAIDLEGYGLQARDLDRAALNDAAELMARGEADDVAHAYELAVARRSEAAPQIRGADDLPFPDIGEGVAPAASSALPIGDAAPAEALRTARGLFSAYKRTFAPRGSGDDVGLALRRIVERDATPNEVAGMLYGAAQAGRTGLSVRIHDRLREALPEGHPAFEAIRQGLISKVIDGGSGNVVARLDHLLAGEGRTLAAKVLTPEQRAGLQAFRDGSVQARNARDSLPDWVRRLGESGFDPNRVTADLFGSGIPGSRAGQADFARSLRSFLGPDSAEWANLRQSAWLRLVQHGEGEKALSPAKEAARIRAFTEGEGKGLATTMFKPDELAQMNRYADVLKVLDIPGGGRLPDAGRAASLASHILTGLAGIVAFKVGGPSGAGAAFTGRVGQRVIQGGLTASRAGRSFNGGAPHVASAAPGYALQFGFGAARLGGAVGDRLVR